MKVFNWEILTVEFLQTKRSIPWIESMMHWLSSMNLAIILGACAFFWVTRNLNWKSKFFYLAFIGLCLLLSDPISHRVIKVAFARPRPFYIVTGCLSKTCWGFVSSHATNIAAIGTFLSFYRPKAALFFIPLFLFVSFSRLYLNKHYPLDVIGGGFIGLLIGIFVFRLAERVRKKWAFVEAVR